MPINPESSYEEEQEPIQEIRIGGGDFIKITKAVEGVERWVGKTNEIVNVQLSKEELDDIVEDLINLPFHIGNPEGTFRGGPEGEAIPDDDRPIHEAEMNISPYIRGVPKGEEKYILAFDFKDSKVWASGLSPHSAKNLRISQPMYESVQNWPAGPEREKIHVRIGFSLEKELTVGGKKIEEIALMVGR